MIQSSTSYGLGRNSSVFAAQSSDIKPKVAGFQDALSRAYLAVSQDEQKFAQTLKVWSARRAF